jgi:hypothetical protein
MRATDHARARFEVVEPSGRVVFWIWMLCVAMPVSITSLALGVVLAGVGDGDGSPAIPFPLTTSGLTIFVVVVLPILITLAILIQGSLRRLSVEIDGAHLVIRAGWYRLSAALADIDVSHARIVNLAEHTEFRPALKANAIQLPGFDVGHFRLRDWRRRAFVLMTQRDRVLALPLRDKRVVLLSLRHPEQLIDALRRAAR